MTTAITLESLGFTKDDLQERVIERLCEQILSGKQYDEDGNEEYDDSQFKKKLEERLRSHITETVNAIAEKHVLPNVTGYIENLVLQTTNSWGEKTGKSVTFIEYLVQRAEAYIQEEVNYEGKSKGQDSYNWSKKSTRITFLIEKHLHYHIETAMKQALQTANSAIAGGIEKAVKIQLEKLLQGVQASVTEMCIRDRSTGVTAFRNRRLPPYLPPSLPGCQSMAKDLGGREISQNTAFRGR